MTNYDSVQTLIGDANNWTNQLATAVQKLIDDINKTASEGLNGPQTENVLAQLAAMNTQLNGVFTNASNPIPPPPPPPPAMPGPFASGAQQ